MRRLLTALLLSLSLGTLSAACQNEPECPDEGCRCDGYCRACPCPMSLTEADAGR